MNQSPRQESRIISIVVPLFNEEDSLLLLHEKIRSSCNQLEQDFEIIYIDDGSQDKTYSILRQVYEGDSKVRVIRFRKNFGQTAAMAAGFQAALGEIVVSLDGDLQNDPADFSKLLSKIDEGYDVVCGWRKNRQDTFLSRRFPSKIANWIMGLVTGVRIHDSGCSLKAFKSSIIKKLPLYGEMHRFIPALSLLVGARIGEIKVEHHARQFGQSKYGIGRIWKVAFDIMIVKMITGFAARPLLWFGLLSLPCLLLGSVFLGFGISIYFDNDYGQWLVPSTVSFLFFFLSGHLLTMGVVGELSINTSDFISNRSYLPSGKFF